MPSRWDDVEVPEFIPSSKHEDSSQVMDRTWPKIDRFCPPREVDLTPWLAPLLEIPRAPVLDLYGLRVPQLIDVEDAGRVDVGEGLLAQVAHDTSHVVQRHPLNEGESLSQPGRYLRLQIEASYLARIEGRDTIAVRDHLDLRDISEDAARNRSRSADRVIRSGDGLWRRLGAWPWAVSDDRLSSNWREHPAVAKALAEWHTAAVAAGTQEVVRLRHRLARGRRGPYLPSAPTVEPS